MTDSVFIYQDEAAKTLAPRYRTGLFDAMGVGKTATAIRMQDYRQHWYASGTSGIVIVPAAIREKWRREFIRFQTVPRRLVKINSIHDMAAWFRGHYDVAIVSFERAASLAPYFQREMKMFDFCIIDEGHYLKSATSKRAQAILGPNFDGANGIVCWAAYADWLTGTPAPNDPSDIWTWLRFLNGPMKLDPIGFKKRYFSTTPTTYGSRCRPREGAMLDELRGIITDNSVARSMTDVGIHLPPLQIVSETVDGDTSKIAELLAQYPGLDSKIISAIEAGADFSTLDDEHVATLRRLVGEAKAIPYAAMLANDLASGLHKIAVFGHHQNALRQIGAYMEKHGYPVVSVQGGANERDRDNAIDSFNHDPKVRVFLGNHRAAGVGLDLQHDCWMIDLFESDWTPTANAQSIKRIARYGQTRKMRCRFIGLNHWLEEQIDKIVLDKTQRIMSLGLPDLL